MTELTKSFLYQKNDGLDNLEHGEEIKMESTKSEHCDQPASLLKICWCRGNKKAASAVSSAEGNKWQQDNSPSSVEIFSSHFIIMILKSEPFHIIYCCLIMCPDNMRNRIHQLEL
jgi:hypothetical protein